MFYFTKTTFVHDKDLFKANPNDTQGTFWADGNLFRKDNVVAVFRNPYIDPVNGKLIIDVASVMKDAACTDRFRLNFYVRRMGDVNSYYSNDFVFKGKDFHYEWTGKTKTAKALAKIFKGINKLYGDVFLKIYCGTEEKDAENGIYVDEKNNLVIESDNYGYFTEATIEKWVETEPDCCVWRDAGHWEVIESLDSWDEPEKICNCSIEKMEANWIEKLPGDDPEKMQPQVLIKKSTLSDCEGGEDGNMRAVVCVNGVGTYEQVLRDLRLPTLENFRWLTPNAAEMPIMGNKYVQYTIHMVTCRGILGGSAVGEVTHSKTTHVFFVPSSCCECAEEGKNLDLDEMFGKALKEAGINVYNAPHNDPVAQRRYGNGIDLADKLAEDTYTAKMTSKEEEEEESEGQGGFPNAGNNSGSNSGNNSGNTGTGTGTGTSTEQH